MPTICFLHQLHLSHSLKNVHLSEVVCLLVEKISQVIKSQFFFSRFEPFPWVFHLKKIDKFELSKCQIFKFAQMKLIEWKTNWRNRCEYSFGANWSMSPSNHFHGLWRVCPTDNRMCRQCHIFKALTFRSGLFIGNPFRCSDSLSSLQNQTFSSLTTVFHAKNACLPIVVIGCVETPLKIFKNAWKTSLSTLFSIDFSRSMTFRFEGETIYSMDLSRRDSITLHLLSIHSVLSLLLCAFA